MNELISYAQNREDIYINWLLAGKKKGFYVDIGASDPIHDSVTKFFYDKGWNGINIEPIERHIKNLQKQRPRDVNLQLGIAEQKGKLNFREYVNGDGLSTFAEESKKEHHESRDYVDYEVNVKRLDDVLDEQNVKAIDFMKIDVEGYEYEVISSNNWNKYRPLLLVIEANHIKRDWHNILIKNGYQKVFFDGLNEYFSNDTTIQQKSVKTYPDFVIGPLILDERTEQHIKWREKVAKGLIEKEIRQRIHSFQNELEDERQKHAQLQNELEDERQKHDLTKELMHKYKAQLDLPFKIRRQNLTQEFFAICKIKVKAWVYPQAAQEYIDTETSDQLVAKLKAGAKVSKDELLATSTQLDKNNPPYIYPRRSKIIIYKTARFIFKSVRKVLRMTFESRKQE